MRRSCLDMNWLNYHHLLYFWTVAKTGSITAAAKDLRLSHPTISAQINTLEKNIGHKLFRQAGRGLELTEMGQLTYRYANDIFSLGAELLQTLEGRFPSGHMRLKIGVADVVPKPIAYQILSPALKLPEVDAVCYEGKPSTLMTQLALHELDLVLSDFPMGPQFALNAFSHVLGESGLSVFAAPRLARKYGRRFPQSLEGAPFLLPTDNTSMRRLMNHWFVTAGIRPRVHGEFEDSELLKEYGRDGGGLFATSTMIEKHTLRNYGVRVVGRLRSVRMRYYVISPERKITNSAVTLIVAQARRDIFG
jgi:LysR family transcriptional regulator, transcriptional activator of nhaA